MPFEKASYPLMSWMLLLLRILHLQNIFVLFSVKTSLVKCYQSLTVIGLLKGSPQVGWLLIADVFLGTRHPPTLWFAHFSIRYHRFLRRTTKLPVDKRWGNDSNQSLILLFASQLGPGVAVADETFWLEKNSLQLLWHQPRWGVISLRGMSVQKHVFF